MYLHAAHSDARKAHMPPSFDNGKKEKPRLISPDKSPVKLRAPRT